MFLFRYFCIFVMRGRLFLVAVLVYLCCAGEALEDVVPQEIVTSVGQTVILPCLVRTSSQEIPSVEWSKEGLNPKPIVFLYRSGCETFEEKNPAFHYRTNLFMNKLKNGDFSLRLSDVQLSDLGTYICKENQVQGPPREVLRVRLSVGAVSEPRLSVVPAAADAGGDGVTLQCDALCWFPPPEITFDVAEENVIRSEPMKNDRDPRGCFNITRRVTVKNSSRVTCRVHQPKINETRITEIYIPDECMKSCTVITITAAIAIITLLVSCALNVYFCKRRSVGGHKFTQAQFSNGRGNAGVYNQTEHLRETAELKLNLREKEEKIHRLTQELTELRSKQSLVVSRPDVSNPIRQDKTPHNNNPDPVASTSSSQHKPSALPQIKDSKPAVSVPTRAAGSQIQTGAHNHSSPALVQDSSHGASPTFPFEKTHVTRSMSESRPRPNKLQRRYTTSMSPTKRFSRSNFPEDEQEQLLEPEEK